MECSEQTKAAGVHADVRLVGKGGTQIFFERKYEQESLLAELKACSKIGNLEWGKKIHAKAAECGHNSSIYIGNALIHMYVKCGSMMDAHQVFDSLKHPDVVSWTALIWGYADHGKGDYALDLFTRIRTNNSVTFLAALNACTSLAGAECMDRIKAIHNVSVMNACSSDMYVQNKFIDMYAKCGSMVDALQLFESMKHTNVVSWTALILGYADNGQGLTSLEFFTRMRTDGPSPNYVTFLGALKACTSLAEKGDGDGWSECRDRGKAVHELASEDGCCSDIIWQRLVDMYVKCGSMSDAREAFESMKHADVLSWTELIMGYADNGQGHIALELFARMRTEGPTPDSVTYMAVLKACGLVGALEFGRSIHSEINRGDDELDALLVTCLVDFYSKCGSLVEAQSVFEFHAEKRNIATWNALLAGFSGCGDNEAMLGLFEQMQDAGLRPNDITFLCILKGCSHAGAVEKGKACFDAMSTKHGVIPTARHYTCMIDLFGRANKLNDAIDLLKSMPFIPDDVTWMTILGACRRLKNVEIGRKALQSLGRRGVSERPRKNSKVLKGDTCWTNEVGEVHTFLSENNQHPQLHEICDRWDKFMAVMRQHGYVPKLLSVSGDITDEEEALCGHSEKLALVCALINTEPGMTIRIVKNLKVCHDCHSATALISKLERRTIICRDASRIHVFKDGTCSCGDYW